MKKIEVVARLKVEGIHFWEKCNIAEVDYLRNSHSHIFHIEAVKRVLDSDREIEFIALSHTIQNYLKKKYFSTSHQCLYFGGKSCEMIASELVDEFKLIRASVSEDGNGASIVYNE